MTPVKTPGMMDHVAPNKPKTPVSNFRIPPTLKKAAIDKAASEGRTLTDVIIEALREYVREK